MTSNKIRNINYLEHQRIRYLVFIVLLFIYPIKSFGQNEEVLVVEEKKKDKRPVYLNISFGLNSSSFRDFATSPLIYSGIPIYTAVSHIDIDKKRTSQIMASYSFGKYKTTFNEHTSESQVNTISVNYSELFQVKKLSSPKFNLKIGGQVSSTLNLRNNGQLFNNRKGVDVISTLFGSVNATIDLSRKEEISKRFLFVRYKAKKRVKNLSYTMNIGLVNTSYRNNFAYLSSSIPINEDEFFADYEFKIFKGFRLNSALDYTIFLNNKNAIQISYLWDAYKTGGHHDNFEMTTHTIKCSLLFGLR